MAAYTFSNPNVPHIDTPMADLQALTTVVTQLKKGVESLAGHRGGERGPAIPGRQGGGRFERTVTLQDLITLGLATEDELIQALESRL